MEGESVCPPQGLVQRLCRGGISSYSYSNVSMRKNYRDRHGATVGRSRDEGEKEGVDGTPNVELCCEQSQAILGIHEANMPPSRTITPLRHKRHTLPKWSTHNVA